LDARTYLIRALGWTSVTGLVRRSDGLPLTQCRAQVSLAVAQIAAWRPDWRAIKVSKKVVKPTAGERATRAVDPSVGPVAGSGSDQLVSLQFKGNDQDPAVQTAKQFRGRSAAALRAHGMTLGFTGGIAKHDRSGRSPGDDAGDPVLTPVHRGDPLERAVLSGLLAVWG
jgi:hypothetical protein